VPEIEPRASSSIIQPPRGSIQAVVFDLGGVITTSLATALDDLLQMYASHLGPSRDRVCALWGSLYIAASLGHIEPDELWQRFRQQVDLGSLSPGQEDREFLSRIHLREADVAATLADLKRRYAVGLLSNHVGSWARALLQRFDLLNFFDGVVISSDIAARKPDPLPYLSICEQLQVPPEHAVYVADQEEDLVGCQALGMFPVFIPGQDASSRVGLWIRRISDLSNAPWDR
jgi:putative hydrolase of the HAD superfamily